MALTKVTGQVIKNTTDVTVGVLTVTNTLSVGGTVSIGGTLTYEDVTNVDAVGLITARDGIVVGSGITLSVDGDIFATGISTLGGVEVIRANNNLGIFTCTNSGANIRLSDNDTETLIRTVDGRLQIYADFQDQVADSEIRFLVDNSLKGVISAGSSFSLDNDPDTFLGHPSGNTLTVTTAGSEAVRINSDGKVLIGATASRNVSGRNANLQIQGTGGPESSLSMTRNTANSSGPHLDFSKSRAASLTDNTLVQDSDTLGDITFSGADGTDTVSQAAMIKCEVDGTPGSNDMPGRLLFKTTSDGASTPTERLRIDSDGRLLVGIATARTMNGRISIIQVEGTEANSSSITIYRNQTNQNAPSLNFGKSRGSGVLDNTLVENGDTIGTISWNAADGTDSESRTAHIRSEVDGTAAANDTPGRIIFSTSASGSGSPSERLRINSEGHLIFDGDSNTYIHRPVADTFAFVNGGTERFRISSVGRIYIGHDAAITASSTLSQLQLTGTANASASMNITRFSDNANGNFIFLSKSRGSTIGTYTATQSGDVIGSIRWCGSDGTDMAEGVAQISGEVDAAVSSNVVPGRLVFQTSRAGTLTEAMRIDKDGHIGINHDAPAQELDIKAISTDATIRLTAAEAGDATIELYADEADDNIDMWRINSDASGGLRFQNYANGNWISTLILTGDTTGSELGQTKVLDGSAAVPGLSFISDADTGFYRIGSNAFGITLGGIHRHRFEGDGDVIFGGNGVEANGSFTIQPDQDDGAARISFNRANTSPLSQAVRFENNTSAVGNISYSDSVTQFNTSSDYRLKENDVVISDGITRLKQLRPIKFNWKINPDTTVDGFFAHEVSSVVPEAINGSKDQSVTQEDIDQGKTGVHDKVGDPMYQSMDHSKLVPLLTAALQEEISKREEEITRQESEINALKERLARAGLW